VVARVVRVLVVADDPLVRSILEQRVVSEGHAIADRDADVAVVDLVGATFDKLRIPVVALAADRRSGDAAFSAGARAVLSRTVESDTLSAAILAASAGLTTVDPELVGLTPRVVIDPRESEELTPREIEVLQHLASGLSNKEIAVRLGISDHTVKFHVNAVLSKLSADSRTEAVVRGVRLGYVIL
jgi:two-component system, NarL family, nitrate/nitrite response regulator NarL